jgi:uncharacterized cupredoxin-like copper-binding protein
VTLDADVSADSPVVSVDDPRYLRSQYQFKVGDEWMQVIGPVDTGQAMGATIGTAQTTMEVSGTAGIEEGMVIRVDGELLRVGDVLRPAYAQITRAQNGTTASEHAAGTPILRAPEEDETLTLEQASIGQSVLDDVSADAQVIAISGTARVNVGDTYMIDGEAVSVLAVDPAKVRIERGVGDTSAEPHARRAPIFAGNQLAVTRGVNDTTPAAHNAGDGVVMVELEVERAVGAEAAEHAKNTELFLGNRLTVARGVLETEPADHEDGELIRNFIEPPDNPPYTGEGVSVCGQTPYEPAPTSDGTEGPTPPGGGGQAVAVGLSEYEVEPDPASVTAGAVTFSVSNDGGTQHNLRVILTDLAPDDLPRDGTSVAEEELDVVAQSDNLNAEESEDVSATLEAGTYVLICNVPTHYQLGMYTTFTVQ